MIIPHWSCYYKIPRSFLYCSENTLCLLPSSSLPHEYPFKKKSSHLSSIRSSPVDSCISQKYSKYYLNFRKSWVAYCSWNSCLLALWLIPYVSSLIDIPCHYHFESVDSICLRIPANIIDPYKLPFRLSCHSFNWNWFSTNPIVVDCTLRLFNLSIPNQSIASDPLIWKS